MTYPAHKMVIQKIIISAIIVFGTQSLLFAEEPQTAAGNFGFLEYTGAPENKKGTTPFDAPIGSILQPSVPLTTAMPMPRPAINDRSTMSTMQQQAQLYRQQGMYMQQQGDVDGALAFYQKAMHVDPAFVPIYNDIGVIYEAKGMTDPALQSYLKAIAIDPNYASSYSNLALMAESKGRLELAAQYWQRRIDLGYAGDPWVAKAEVRLRDIRAILDKKTQGLVREQEISKLITDVSVKKAAPKPAAPKPVPATAPAPAAKPASTAPTLQGGAPRVPDSGGAAPQGGAPRVPDSGGATATVVVAKPAAPKQEELVTAQKRLAEANEKFRKGDFLSAYMDALEAQALDPTNPNITKLVDILQKKLMSSR